MELLQDLQASVEQLKVWAIRDNRKQRMTQWVETIFAPTERPYVKNLGQVGRLGDNGSIRYWELRAAAIGWDREGITTPMEFVNAMECEVVGTAKHAVVTEALFDFGQLAWMEERTEWAA